MALRVAGDIELPTGPLIALVLVPNEPRHKTQCDDAARGGAGDKIEVARHGRAAEIAHLQSREEGGREDPPDAAAIDGKDAKLPIRRPREWNAALTERSGGRGVGTDER